MPTPVNLTFGGMPGGAAYCPASWNAFGQALIAATTASWAGSSDEVVIGNTLPVLADQGKPWIKADMGSTPIQMHWPPIWFWHSTQNSWVYPHPVAASSSLRQLWVGSTATLQTFDGGDVNAPGDASGPMWEVDTAFAAKFLCAPGTFAASGTLAVTGSTTDTAVSGEDQHTLTAPEIPAHTHDLTGYQLAGPGPGPPNKMISDDDYDAGVATDATTDAGTGGGTAHNNLPPMYGVYVIKRTARKFYKYNNPGVTTTT